MEWFLGLRKPVVEEESPRGESLPAVSGEDEPLLEPQAETSSKLGALLVILAPFAVAAWVAIGFFIHSLLT